MEDLTTIRTFLYRHEAELVRNLLSAYGIESIISADDCGGYRPHLSFTSGGVRLLVNKTDLEKAEKILQTLEAE